MSEIDTSKLYLASPALSLKRPYIEMLTEWHKTGERIIPWVLRLNYSDFQKLVENLNSLSNGSGIYAKHVPGSTFWLMDTSGKMIGASNIRHRLDNKNAESGGHIGYGIRPGMRGQGYATILLRLSLIEIKKLGVEDVVVCCDSDNIASERVIAKNTGVFEAEVLSEGVLTKIFRIRNS